MQNHQQLEPGGSFEELFQQAELLPEYWEERAKLEFTRDVIVLMGKNDVSRTELASRLLVTPAFVTKLLSGRNNFEIVTMVRVAMALNCRFKTHLEPVGAKTVWFDVFDSGEKTEASEVWNPSQFRRLELLTVMQEECYETVTATA